MQIEPEVRDGATVAELRGLICSLHIFFLKYLLTNEGIIHFEQSDFSSSQGNELAFSTLFQRGLKANKSFPLLFLP